MALEIVHPRQLLVEGPADEMLFQALIEHLGVSGIQIHNIEEVDNLQPYLRTLIQTSGFQDIVTSLAIVRDADQDAVRALDSVHDALIGVDLPAPSESLMPIGTDPKIVILVVPHGEPSGALEDVCLASVTDDPAMICVDEYMKCVQEHAENQPNNKSKSRLQAFLSSRRQPGMLLGAAAREGYWIWGHAAFEPLKQLLQLL